jgi:hypothetical protein
MWGNGVNAGLLAPISKGQQITILHAGSETALIPHVLNMKAQILFTN